MKSYFVKTPKYLSSLFKDQTWQFSAKNKELYLTFDDGPTPGITDWVLDVLKEYKAQATFFCIGKNINQHLSLFKRVLEEGHAVGNHTYEHLSGWKTTKEDYMSSILKAEEIIQDSRDTSKSGSEVKLFRPPYGRIKKVQTKELVKLNFKIIMWSVLSADFDLNSSPDTCLQNVIKHVTNGDILVFHDSQKAFGKLQIILPKILDYYKKRGYSFKKIESATFN